jgi:hypothetical protein
LAWDILRVRAYGADGKRVQLNLDNGKRAGKEVAEDIPAAYQLTYNSRWPLRTVERHEIIYE